MRKLAPAWVSYRDDFFISYHVYIMTGSFHISLFEGTLHVDKVHVRLKIANISGGPISHRNRWSFCVYMIPLRDFVPEWNSCPGTRIGVNSHWGDWRRHDILWWYHVNKYRAMRVNWSELTPERKSPWCHVNTPWVPKTLIFKTRANAKSCCENEFHLHENEKSFSYQWLFTKPRLETEAGGHSEMTYSSETFVPLPSYTSFSN